MKEILKGFELDYGTNEKTPNEFDRLISKSVNPYEPKTHDEAWRLAKIVADSGMYGLAGAPEQAYVILMCGKDLGLSQSQALRGIQNIRGKPAPAADTLVAVCLASPLCEYIERDTTRSTPTSEVWKAKRRGRNEQTYTFDLEKAERAGLIPAKKDTPWDSWPERMMAARAKAFLARDVFPDLTLGLLTAEELHSEPTAPPPSALSDVAKWQEPPQSNDATLLDPVEPEPEPEPEPELPWQDRMRAAKDKAEATRIGKEAVERDPSRRAEAIKILKEGFRT